MEKNIYFNISSSNPLQQDRAIKQELSALKPSLAGEGWGEEKYNNSLLQNPFIFLNCQSTRSLFEQLND